MKVFKIIMKILFCLIFVISVATNIILFKYSYGSLIFKKDEELLTTMINNSLNKYDDFYSQKNIGYTIEFGFNGKDESNTTIVNLHFDKESNLTYFATFADNQGNVSKSYFKENTLYIESADGIRSKRQISSTDSLDINNLLLIIREFTSSTNFELNKVETSASFSFSPFYLIGVKVSSTKDDFSISNHYDLRGDLRKIEVDDDGDRTFIIISSNKKEVSLPDLSEF